MNYIIFITHNNSRKVRVDYKIFWEKTNHPNNKIHFGIIYDSKY